MSLIGQYCQTTGHLMKFGDHRDLCRSYDQCDGPGAIKIFGEGTKLIVVPLDTILDEDTSPKPSMFLPSASETNIDEAGTYLCLLEQFFPEAIKVYWKEKDHGGLLQSQQGDTVKINNTYMKLSWVTVARDAMTKELTFVVRHENNKGGVDQEIVFPPIKKVTSDPEACLEIENDIAETSKQLKWLLTPAQLSQRRSHQETSETVHIVLLGDRIYLGSTLSKRPSAHVGNRVNVLTAFVQAV